MLFLPNSQNLSKATALCISWISLTSPPNFTTSTRSDIYEIDNSDDIVAFTRIAYFMHLESVKFGSQCVWVSMDAFTDNVQTIGVPTFSSNAKFQVEVKNMNVVSNVDIDGVAVVGSAGNIEFWPSNYAPAANGVDDHSDYRYESGNYGSMQISSCEFEDSFRVQPLECCTLNKSFRPWYWNQP
jgi:hypothetical protein